MRAFPIIASLVALFILPIANVGPALRAEVSPAAIEAHYTPLPDRAVIPPTMACADLPKRDFLSLKGAPSRISSAELVKGESGEEFCFVKGMIAPQIGPFSRARPRNQRQHRCAARDRIDRRQLALLLAAAQQEARGRRGGTDEEEGERQ